MSEFYYPLECGWDIVPGAMALVSNITGRGRFLARARSELLFFPVENDGAAWRARINLGQSDFFKNLEIFASASVGDPEKLQLNLLWDFVEFKF